jgi:hypothetical protein
MLFDPNYRTTFRFDDSVGDIMTSKSLFTELVETLKQMNALSCGGYFLYLRGKLRFTPPVDSRDATRREWETL